MLTLSFGYKKPQNTDTGDVVFPALEADIQQLNDHIHDNITSALLFTKTQTISSGPWGAYIPGILRQLVTVPTGYSFDTCDVWFKLSTGQIVYPSIERVSSTTYYIYTNDGSLSYTAFYR